MAPIFYFIRRMRSPRGFALFLAVFSTLVREQNMTKLATCALFAMFLCVPYMFAQDTTGSIEGIVGDPVGPPAPNAEVVAQGANHADRYVTATDAYGQYHFSGIPAGSYTITASSSGSKLGYVEVSVVPGRVAEINVSFTIMTPISIPVVSGPCFYCDLQSENITVDATIPLTPLEPLPLLNHWPHHDNNFSGWNGTIMIFDSEMIERLPL